MKSKNKKKGTTNGTIRVENLHKVGVGYAFRNTR